MRPLIGPFVNLLADVAIGTLRKQSTSTHGGSVVGLDYALIASGT